MSTRDRPSARQLVALPPTAATLLRCGQTDGRSVLTILASDTVVSRTLQVVAGTLGYEPNLAVLMQRAGTRTIASLGIAIDLWASGSSTRSATISSTHMALGPLVVGCLAPLVMEQDFAESDDSLQLGTAAFALFGSLALSIVARQEPALFERVAELARYRSVPLIDVYFHVAGETVHATAQRLAAGWDLPRELSIALSGPEETELTPNERAMVAALDAATVAARAAAVSVEPWPYVAASGSVEGFALQQALSLRARRISARLSEELIELSDAA